MPLAIAFALARHGVSLLKIQKWMGHSDPRITMQHYAHLSPTFDEDINKIGKSVPA
ncbi:MAG: tyrosine-type recombinase/integrase [Candidatus Omnitrophica bacterium]|nr:tyrosine-type recombinase/integrase [Candidatus Omnitrophota bacterium]